MDGFLTMRDICRVSNVRSALQKSEAQSSELFLESKVSQTYLDDVSRNVETQSWPRQSPTMGRGSQRLFQINASKLRPSFSAEPVDEDRIGGL